jgi:hypothetical protein
MDGRVRQHASKTLKSQFTIFRGSKLEPSRAVDAHNGGLEAQNEALKGHKFPSR